MKENYHLFKDGTLQRSENTLRLDAAGGDTHHLPVEAIDALYAHGQLEYNTKLLGLLNDHEVELHVFGWNGQYLGSHLPRHGNISGNTLVEQVDAYKQSERRLPIAQKIVEASIHNMERNIEYYDSRGRDLETQLQELERVESDVDTATDVDELRGVEADARRTYYSAFDQILSAFEFEKRTYNPPQNELNAFISYANSLVYASIVSAIRKSALNPTISYLHEPGERRYSLSLDLADIFKPLLADRIVFRLANRNQVTPDDFNDEVDGILLYDDAQKLVAQTFEDELEETIEHSDLNRHVSYKYLLRLEAYKLQKHVTTSEPYEPFKRWW